MQGLIDNELPKENKFETEDEKERKQRELGRSQLVNECNRVQELHQITGGQETKKSESHSAIKKLLDRLHDDCQFYIVRLPNQDCLNASLTFRRLPLV